MNLPQLLDSASSPEQWAQTFAWPEQYMNPGSPSGFSPHRVGISEQYKPDFRRQRGAGRELARAFLPPGVWYRRTDGIELDERGRICLGQGQGAPLPRE